MRNNNVLCEVCGKPGAVFTGFQGEGPDARDAENTPDNLPFGKAWVCLDCLDSLSCVPAEDPSDGDAVIITWDYKDQIDVTELNRALQKIEGPARAYEVETDGDFFALVVCSATKDQAWADKVYAIACKLEDPAPNLGPLEPPQDYRIFNKRQADGSYRPLNEFFDRKEN